jgi:hypothetical protein
LDANGNLEARIWVNDPRNNSQAQAIHTFNVTNGEMTYSGSVIATQSGLFRIVSADGQRITFDANHLNETFVNNGQVGIWTERLRTGERPAWMSAKNVRMAMVNAWNDAVRDQRERGAWVILEPNSITNLWGLLGPQYDVQFWEVGTRSEIYSGFPPPFTVGEFHTHEIAEKNGGFPHLLSPDDITHILSYKLPSVVITPDGYDFYYPPKH